MFYFSVFLVRCMVLLWIGTNVQLEFLLVFAYAKLRLCLITAVEKHVARCHDEVQRRRSKFDVDFSASFGVVELELTNTCQTRCTVLLCFSLYP